MQNNIIALNMMILFRVLITEMITTIAEDRDGSEQLIGCARQLVKILYEERYYCFSDTDMEPVLHRYFLLFDGICSMYEKLPKEGYKIC